MKKIEMTIGAHETIIMGVKCVVKDGCYTFTVPGWDECTVYGFSTARRVIRGRLDAAVRNTLDLDK